jgi:hypothetical protein
VKIYNSVHSAFAFLHNEVVGDENYIKDYDINGLINILEMDFRRAPLREDFYST